MNGLALDEADPRPLYVQIADAFAARIESGEIEDGARLPPMRALARDLHVAIVTVGQAYDALAARGRAVARPGRGTFAVAAPARPSPSESRARRRWESGAGATQIPRLQETGERLARAATPGAISLANGHPAPETFPLAEFGRCLARTLADDPPETMQYASGSGDADLRDAFAASLRARGVDARADDILVCSGAQQAAELVAATLLGERAVVAAESPSYAPTLAVFDARGASYVELAADADGLRVDDVERVFESYRPRLCYVNPFAQNPTGRILRPKRAKAIVELARRYDVVVLEDQTGWVFSYDGAPPAPLAAYDTDGHVVAMESLSKTVFPALRIGYCFARGRLREELELAKMRADSFTSTLAQRALWRFLKSPAYPKHLRLAKSLYRARRDAFVDALQSVVPWTEIVPPAAGMTLWLPLPPRLSSSAAFEACAREGVLVMPADSAYPTRAGRAALRLGFGDLDEATAREAVRRLGRALAPA